MDVIGDALRQAFMPKHEYHNLREEDKALIKLQRPICMVIVGIISLAIVISTAISLNIVFPGDAGNRPFCNGLRIEPLPINVTSDSDSLPEAFYLTDQQTVDYFYVALFLPSLLLFMVSVIYLVAGIMVAYSAPQRHGCLRVVENNYCASRRGGVRCLAILNMVFAVIFGLLALFLGSSLLTLGSNCSLPLFWCYEVVSWSLVILHGGTAFCLRRKAAVILDEGSFSGRNLGLEMLEANPYEVTPDVERRVNEGFKTWMGSSLLSSDEDEPDDYLEASYPNTSANQSRQRLSTS
ncbi:hypothetical protein Cgig2_010001 [Carnegiea gigantea]|uniref:Transmembrane protein n=1 Tax=Carnegiea gigantea TaxID=171969 RepID=A0A9Q1JWT3_9CARY|nr:hypothetical protein Cgig2_010001 [Carnegiea gigantea]